MSYGNNGIVPQFNYGAGFGTTFSPTFAARQKQPIATLGQEATRHDSITTSGLQQSIVERVDRVFDLDFPMVPQSDLAGWDAFIAWAIQGQQFQYIPDNTATGTYVTCYLTSDSVPYKWVAYQLFSISLKLRVVVTAEIGS
jgi:hypothetical protein